MSNNSKAVKTIRPIAPAKSEPVVPVVTAPVIAPVRIVAGMYTTMHVAQLFNMTPFELRKVLRSMEEWNDGAHTPYRWVSIEQRADGTFVDESLDRVRLQVAKRANSYAAAKSAAQARFQAAQAQVNAQREADAKLAAALAAKTAPAKRKK
jgi:hypothetical protein